MDALKMNRDSTFTDYIRSLEPGGSADPAAFDATWEKLRKTLANQMRKRSLWQSPPAFLGIVGFPRWFWGDPLEELAADCYLFIFEVRLRSLRAQLEVRLNVDGLVIRNVRHFLSRRQELCDPIGRRVYSVLVEAAGRLIEAGELHVLGEDSENTAGVPKLANETVLGFARGPAPSQAWNDDLGEHVRSWNDDLLPDLITAMGRGASNVIQRLMAHLRGLRDTGCEAFRFKDLLDALKSDVRARWKVLQESQLLQPPGKDFEQRERFEELVACMEDCLDAQRGSERRIENLWKLWRLIRAVTAGSWAGEAAEPPAQSFPGELPSRRKMAKILDIPKNTLFDLDKVIRRCAEGCLVTS